MKSSTKFLTFPTNTPNDMQASGSMSGSESDWHVSVLIPARNEEALLARCLLSVQRAQKVLPSSVTSNIVLVDDDSSDATRAIAEKLLRHSGIVVHTRGCMVGKARALAASTAIARHKGSSHRHWLANTDADCSVPETWLLDQLAVTSAHVEAIAGVVSVDDFRDHDREVATRFRDSYILHPDGTHPHVHGANLGVRADAYLRAGGWNPLETAEDHDLWNRLQGIGAACVALGSLSVVTSGRRVGRAPLGFAGALAAHNNLPVGAQL